MGRNQVLFLPFFFGLALMVFSWYLSYPLSMDSVNDFVFNHVSTTYWLSLTIMLASMCLIAMTSKSELLKWAMIVGAVLTMYSISYFYFMLPGSDSQYFRGLNEYLINTKDLNPSQSGKVYLQWPSLFTLTYVATSISGLQLVSFEFLMYGVIGLQIATALYLLTSKSGLGSGFLPGIAFFIAMFYYLNYQFVPYSLAFGLLLLLFVLETRQRSRALTASMLIIFVGMTITHAYLPLIFVLYLSARFIINGSERRHRLELIMLCLVIYFATEVTLAYGAFVGNILAALTLDARVEFSRIVKTPSPVFVPIDSIAQTLSSVVLVATVSVCVIGFFLILARRKMQDLHKAIFLAGAAYTGVGMAIFTLGSRAIPIAFIPISLGVSYLLQRISKSYFKYFFLILIVLFSSIPIHLAFYNGDVMFQTKEAYAAENFFIDHYDSMQPNLILANFRVVDYLETKMAERLYFSYDPKVAKEADLIIYTVGLGRHLLYSDYTMEDILGSERLNVIYDNSFSLVAIRSWNFTWSPRG